MNIIPFQEISKIFSFNDIVIVLYIMVAIASIEAGIIIWLKEEKGSLRELLRLAHSRERMYQANSPNNKPYPTTEEVEYCDNLNDPIQARKNVMRTEIKFYISKSVWHWVRKQILKQKFNTPVNKEPMPFIQLHHPNPTTGEADVSTKNEPNPKSHPSLLTE